MPSSAPSTTWLRELRTLHDESFAFNWQQHLADVNERYDLSGPDAFGLPTALPRACFAGDTTGRPQLGSSTCWIPSLPAPDTRRAEIHPYIPTRRMLESRTKYSHVFVVPQSSADGKRAMARNCKTLSTT